MKPSKHMPVIRIKGKIIFIHLDLSSNRVPITGHRGQMIVCVKHKIIFIEFRYYPSEADKICYTRNYECVCKI